MEKFTRAEKTRSGLFGLWEQGGSVSRSEASSVVIARGNGSKPRAIFSSNEKNGKHALVVLQKGFIVVEASRSDANGIKTNHLLNGFWQVFILDGSSDTEVFQFVVKEVDGVVRLLLTELF